MTPEQLRENGHKLFEERSYAAAVPVLSSAVEAFPKDETLWQELVLAGSWSGQHASAVDFAKSAVRNHPRSDWLWRQLGSELTALDRLDEAESALNNSRTLNPKAEWLWRYFATLHRKRNNPDKEIEGLEILHSLGKANGTDLNQLGIAFYNQKNFGKALAYYRLSAATNLDVAPLFNMGLVFNDPEVSQDADAADAYRRTLELKADYERGQKELEATKTKLIPLAEKARAEAVALTQPDDYFRFYLSPFEAFQIQDIESPDKLEVKAVQRAKKLLLHEIDLNDGKVTWLENHALDKSRALTLEDELHDDIKREHHWAVFQNKPLLRFLTRGDIEHFLFSDDYFPRETLERLEDDPHFLPFLSKPFARQYNFVLTRAIENRLLSVIEALFDGRRWVEAGDDDVCFQGAYRHCKMLVEWVAAKAKSATSVKPDHSEIAGFIENLKVAETLNLLPTAFRPAQSQFVGHLRSLAIAAHNEHSDSESSAQILGLCKQFRFKSTDLNKRLEEDSKALEEILADNRKNSFSAWVRENQAVYITHTGIKLAGNSINADEVEAIRWGIYVRTINGIESEHSCTLVVSSARDCLQVRWDKRGIIGDVKNLFRMKDAAVPISQLSSTDQEAYFRKMIDAVVHHLIPPLLTKLVQRLRGGTPINVGPCSLTQSGIAFRTGIIFQKDHLIPWRDAKTEMQDGQVCVFNRRNGTAQISMPARDTDNAVILPILCNAMREGVSSGESTVENDAPAHPAKKFGKGWLVFVGILAAFGLIRACDSSSPSSSTTSSVAPSPPSSTATYTPPPVATQPTDTTPSFPVIPNSESKAQYRVPSYMTAELDRDSRAIDDEKANAERMASQLEALSRDIERSKLYLDRTSQIAIDEFNSKVDSHNALVGKVRAQNRLVNQMVENYNAKLRKYDR